MFFYTWIPNLYYIGESCLTLTFISTKATLQHISIHKFHLLLVSVLNPKGFLNMHSIYIKALKQTKYLV